MTHTLKMEVDSNNQMAYILYRIGNNDINNKITIKRNSVLKDALITIIIDDSNTTCESNLGFLINLLENINNENILLRDNTKKSNIHIIMKYIKNNYENIIFTLKYPYTCNIYYIFNEFNNSKTITDYDKNSIIIFRKNEDKLKYMILQKYIDARYTYRFSFLS